MRTPRCLSAVSRAVLGLLLVVALLPPVAMAQAQGDAREIVLRVETPDYRWDESGLHVPGYATLETPGAPALPVWSTVLELPPEGQWSLSYAVDETVTLALAGQLPAVAVPQPDLDGPVAWQDRADLPAYMPLVDQPDPAIYGQDVFYPAQPVQAGPEQWQRGRRLLVVRAFPFQVNPISGELRYYPSLRITVTIDAADGAHQHAATGELSTPLADAEEVDGALRIHTVQRGLHRLTYQDLQAAGVPLATLNPATLAVNTMNQPVDISGDRRGRWPLRSWRSGAALRATL